MSPPVSLFAVTGVNNSINNLWTLRKYYRRLYVRFIPTFPGLFSCSSVVDDERDTDHASWCVAWYHICYEVKRSLNMPCWLATVLHIENPLFPKPSNCFFCFWLLKNKYDFAFCLPFCCSSNLSHYSVLLKYDHCKTSAEHWRNNLKYFCHSFYTSYITAIPRAEKKHNDRAFHLTNHPSIWYLLT